MKVIVLIPCLNEETTLPAVLKDIPRSIKGVDKLEILVVNDGSTDSTVAVAKTYGVKHFVHHKLNQGLARSFHDGVMEALSLGADIIVTTDGDNQYPQADIPRLIQPILDSQADIVIADRQTHTIEHFSRLKKFLQKVGSRVVSFVAGVSLPDAASGFRAYSADSLIQINIITRFSYTMETIIQAGSKGLAITSIPIKTNPKTRESRLFKSTHEHVIRSAVAIIRAYIMYRPLVFFNAIGTTLLTLGLLPFIRFAIISIIHAHNSTGAHHLQSLIVGTVLIMVAGLLYALGVIADLIRINRVLNEYNLELSKRLYLYGGKRKPPK
jgi:glycosyltransferase involved in cell wall biosynthesis